MKSKDTKSKIGLVGRLKCLKTVQSKDPLDGINFVIWYENKKTYLVKSGIDMNMTLEVNKKHFKII